MRALLAILALGCGGGSKASTTPKPVATCSAAAKGMVALMQKGGDNVDEERGEYATIIEGRCEKDSWSPEAKDCLSTMTKPDDAQVCATLLTDEQQGNLVADQDARLKAKQAAEPAPEAAQPQPAAVQPPPPPPAPPAEKEEGQMGKKDPPKKKKKAAPKPDRRQGDPCDGGESR